MGLTHPIIAAYAAHKLEAAQALAAFQAMCTLRQSRIPGCDTVVRLAWRLEHGHTVESAALREYLYRWALAIRAGDQLAYAGRQGGELVGLHGCAVSAWGNPPHAIGL